MSGPQPRTVPEGRYPLDLDIGEVALGYHLIARSVSLTDENLFFEYAFVPEPTEEARQEVWLNMFYDADISPPDWNYVGAGGRCNTPGRRGRLGTHGSTSSTLTTSGWSIWTTVALTATTCGTG